MNDARLEEIVETISEKQSPVEVLEALTELVDEVDDSWRQRMHKAAISPEDRQYLKELFPDVFWEDKEPEEYVTQANVPALPPEDLV